MKVETGALGTWGWELPTPDRQSTLVSGVWATFLVIEWSPTLAQRHWHHSGSMSSSSILACHPSQCSPVWSHLRPLWQHWSPVWSLMRPLRIQEKGWMVRRCHKRQRPWSSSRWPLWFQLERVRRKKIWKKDRKNYSSSWQHLPSWWSWSLLWPNMCGR